MSRTRTILVWVPVYGPFQVSFTSGCSELGASPIPPTIFVKVAKGRDIDVVAQSRFWFALIINWLTPALLPFEHFSERKDEK